MDYLMWLLAAGGVFPAPPAVLDTARAPAAQEAAADTAGTPLAPPALALPAAVPIPVLQADWTRWSPAPFAADSAAPQRPRAIEYSESYHIRLAIHRAASFATLPLFVAEYVVGQKLYNGTASQSTRDLHQTLATGIAGLFAVNTVTGLWNLWDSRKDPSHRTRRWIHSALMLAADAGFMATAANAPERDEFLVAERGASPSLHRTLAISSMGTALASYLMMLVWRN